MIRVVVLLLSVYDTSTGTLLLEENGRQFQYSPLLHNNPIEQCRKAGVKRAHELTEWFKPQYPYASTNVDCHWETVAGEPA